MKGHEKGFTSSLQKGHMDFCRVWRFCGGGYFLHFLKTILKASFPALFSLDPLSHLVQSVIFSLIILVAVL